MPSTGCRRFVVVGARWVTSSGVTVDSSASAQRRLSYPAAKVLTLTFKPGQWQKSVTVKVCPDGRPEPNETILVALSNPSAALAIGRDTGTLTILNDD